jgi:hypothetical protein
VILRAAFQIVKVKLPFCATLRLVCVRERALRTHAHVNSSRIVRDADTRRAFHQPRRARKIFRSALRK